MKALLRDAADLLEEAEKLISDCPAVEESPYFRIPMADEMSGTVSSLRNPWTRIGQGLPDFGELVLVAFDTHSGKQYTTARFVHQKMCADPRSDNYADIWYVEVSRGHELKTVTHWMKLPGEPK